MKLRIAPAISQEIPRLLLGMVMIKNANNARGSSVVPQLVRGAIASKQKELKKLAPEQRESVELWKKITKEPHLLNILKTIEKVDYLTYGNALEDLAFHFSVKYEMPIACFDLDEVCGDIELAHASGGEPFRPRATIKLEHTTAHEVIYRDRAGSLTRDWSSFLSQRTALTTDTRNAVWIMETIGDITLEKMKAILKEMEKTIKTYCGGSMEMAIIGETITEIDLGAAGKTGLNDAEYKPDPRRLAFHQKLLENFDKLKKEKGGLSLAVIRETVKLEKPTEPKNLEEAVEEKKLPSPAEEKDLPPAPEEKDLPAPVEEKLLPAPAGMSTPSLPAPSKTELSLIEMLTKKFIKHPEPIKREDLPFLGEKIKMLIEHAIKKAFTEAEMQDFEPFVEQSKGAEHGDYATNIAMVLGKKLGKSPKEIAELLMATIEKPTYLASVTFAPPGFINFALDTNWVSQELTRIVEREPPYIAPRIGNKQTVLVEYSAPNIAKPLGVHHLLSTIIGQAIHNMYEFLGYKTVAINHIGDWGTQFGKLTVAYKLWGDKKKVEKDPIEELLKLYVDFHNEVEKDAEKGKELEQQARDEFKKLENGDKENTKLWQWFVAMSLKDTQKTYDALGGIHFDKIQGESFYSDKMDTVLQEGKVKGIFEIGEEGALVVKFRNENGEDKYPPFLVQKSDGATLYGTRDLAAVKYRLETWNPLKVIYVVDSAQSLHFQQLFETARKLGWDHFGANSGGHSEAKEMRSALDSARVLIHVPFGRMSFEDSAMSTRKGNILRLNEVLKEAVERAKAIVAQKSSNIPEKKHPELARIIGIGAVKYNILSQNRSTDIVFSWDKMLSLDGNSAPYLQYTCARANSILKKAATEKRVEKRKGGDKQFTLFDAISRDERDAAASPGRGSESPDPASSSKTLIETHLSSQLLKFSEVVYRASEEYRPNIITNYLYETAKLFNAFYHDVPVLQAESETLRLSRLQLTEATKVIIKAGLELIGIEAPDEM